MPPVASAVKTPYFPPLPARGDRVQIFEVGGAGVADPDDERRHGKRGVVVVLLRKLGDGLDETSCLVLCRLFGLSAADAALVRELVGDQHDHGFCSRREVCG